VTGHDQKILIALPFAETARNILRTETFPTLLGAPGVRTALAVAAPLNSESVREFEQSGVQLFRLPPYEPTLRERIVNSVRRGQLQRVSTTFAIQSKNRLSPALLSYGLGIAGSAIFGDSTVERVLRRIDSREPIQQEHLDLLARASPDLVCVTRAINWSPDYPLLRAAQKLGIPTVALVASWDNLTSKAFPVIPGPSASLVVWNNIMKDEAVEGFGFAQERVFVSGVPRFDRYFQRQGPRTRRDFFSALGLDDDRKLLTYATAGDRLFEPADAVTPEPELCKELVDAAVSGRFARPVQVIIRLHPQANPEDWKHFRDRSNVLVQVPGRATGFRDRDLSEDEEQLLAETMCHSDVVVNVASTITIDAAIFDTPVVCVGFDIRAPRKYRQSLRRFYDFEHYRKLRATGGFRIAANRDRLFAEIDAYLVDPTRDTVGRSRIVAEQCQFVDGRSAERVAHMILQMLHATCGSR